MQIESDCDKADWYDAATMAAFLDCVCSDIDKNPSKLIPYAEKMDAELEQLLEGVELP